MDRRITIGAAMLILMAAGPIFAGFGASDLIYVPVASFSPGAVGSQWRSDFYITNVADTPIDVAIAYLPSGLTSNSVVFQSRSTWLGGREDDGWGSINEQLADIPPNGSVVIRNIVGEYWSTAIGASGNGALVVASWEAGTLDADGNRVYKDAVVNTRIYNDTTIWVEDPDNPGDFEERQAQYGQTMPGVPWYNFADGGAVGDTYDLTFEDLTGGEETSRLRYNVGVVNASDAQTSLTVRIQPFQSNGEPFLDDEDIEIATILNMPPASHVQLFRPFRDEWELTDTEGAIVRIKILAWTSSGPNPIPMLTSYGSVVNNNTSDPSTVLPSFAYPYDIECMWGEPMKRSNGSRRPIEIPARAR
jgi:hypothetical protein